MSLFNQLGSNAQANQQPQQMNIMQMVQQFKASPSQFLKANGKNIPDGMSDPMQIIQYLVQSGQVPVGRYQQILQQFQQMTGRK